MTIDTAESGPIVNLPLLAPNVAIVGFAEGHVGEAPYEDASFETWGINRLHTVTAAEGKRFTRWFNLHDLEQFHGQDEEHLAFLKAFDGPVYLRAADIGKYDIPNAVPFPDAEMTDRFGRYFNNTISWLIAYAITLDPKVLGVYGVDMAQDSLMNAEYSSQDERRIFFPTSVVRILLRYRVRFGNSTQPAERVGPVESDPPVRLRRSRSASPKTDFTVERGRWT
jgi:hypothetical protein